MSGSAERKRANDAARQRRRRRREALDEIVVPVPISGAFVTWLVDTGKIDGARAWERPRLARAIRDIVTGSMSRVTDGFPASGVESENQTKGHRHVREKERGDED